MQAAHPTLTLVVPECNRGWWPILDTMYSRIEATTVQIGFQQVKEKYGGLRVYFALDSDLPEDEYDRLSKEIDAIIRDAEQEAVRTCEWCGQPGRTRTFGDWYITLCDRHAEEHERTRKGLR